MLIMMMISLVILICSFGDDSCLNYDLLIVLIVKLENGYGVDHEENVTGGVLYMVWWLYSWC